MVASWPEIRSATSELPSTRLADFARVTLLVKGDRQPQHVPEKPRRNATSARLSLQVARAHACWSTPTSMRKTAVSPMATKSGRSSYRRSSTRIWSTKIRLNVAAIELAGHDRQARQHDVRHRGRPPRIRRKIASPGTRLGPPLVETRAPARTQRRFPYTTARNLARRRPAGRSPGRSGKRGRRTNPSTTRKWFNSQKTMNGGWSCAELVHRHLVALADQPVFLGGLLDDRARCCRHARPGTRRAVPRAGRDGRDRPG